jgi:hypothetical protein
MNVPASSVRGDLEKIKGWFKDHPTMLHHWLIPAEPEKHWIEDWLDRCTKMEEAQKNTLIAEAAIDEGKAARFKKEFEEGFRNCLVLVQFLLDIGAYELEDDLNAFRPKNLVPKTAVIEPPLGYVNTLGEDFGRQYGHGLDREFVTNLLAVSKDTDECTDYKSAFEKATEWLQARGCARNDGLLILLGPADVSSLLMDDAAFIPAWREAVGVAGLEGRYKGFAVWEGRLDRERKLIAVDLREFRPLRRPAGDRNGPWTEVVLREITPDEIKAIQADRKAKDKAIGEDMVIRQNCVADISIKARFVLPEAPPVKVYAVESQDSAPAADAGEAE